MADKKALIGLTLVGLGIYGLSRRRGVQAGQADATAESDQPEGTGEPPTGEPEPEPEPPPQPPGPVGPEGQPEPPFVPPEPQPPKGTFGGPTGPGHPGPKPPAPPFVPPEPPPPQGGVFGEPTGPGHSGLHCEPISSSGSKLSELVRYDEVTPISISIPGFKTNCTYEVVMSFCLGTYQATFGWIDQFAETDFSPGHGGVPKEYGIQDYRPTTKGPFGGNELYTPIPRKFRLHYAYKRQYKVRVHVNQTGRLHLSNKRAYSVENGSASDACTGYVNKWPKPTVGDNFYIPGSAGGGFGGGGSFGSPATSWKPAPQISWVPRVHELRLRVLVPGIPHFGAHNGKPYLEPLETTRYKLFYAVHATPVA